MLPTCSSEYMQNMISWIMAFGFSNLANRTAHRFICNLHESKCHLLHLHWLLLLLIYLICEYLELYQCFLEI